MRPQLVFLITWLDAGVGAVVGSMLGRAVGPAELYVGAAVGGVIGVWLGVQGAVRFAGLARQLRAGAFWGGVAGFVVAVPLALANLHSPLIAIASCGLVGAGVLVGAGMVRGT